MTKSDTARFLQVLRAKQAELDATRLGLDSIAVERSADALEEAQHKYERDLAIANFDRDSSARHSVAAAFARIKDGTFGTCTHCAEEISNRRLAAVPWAPLCIRCQEAADRGEERVLEHVRPGLLDAA